jgi:hypothetical protein
MSGNHTPRHQSAANSPAEPNRFVFVCERCGRPLARPSDVCRSADHTSAEGQGVGRAVRSTDLVRLAAAARAALGGLQ